ncbi:FAD-binding oxidoreductase [Sediminibacterium sp.]|uniref:FAD-binding oxidoreductase n=1 Tax=Sediminibacterium sp. TaxID=1917865 RepID=UPI003F717A2D
MSTSRRSFISQVMLATGGLSVTPSFAAFLENNLVQNPIGATGKWMELAKLLKGSLIMASDLDFAKFNTQYALAYLTEIPEAIALCTSEKDVIACVKWARKHKVPIVPRSGGHSYAAFSRNTGLIVDLSQMTDIKFDGTTNLATLEGGVHNQQVYNCGRLASVSVSHGRCKGVGVAGLVLGGGIGFNMRKYGLTCDQLISTRIVLANGEVIVASATENPEVFWAIRGAGGGNFGIHTQFVMQMFPVSTVTWFRIQWRTSLEQIFDMFQDIAMEAPPELGVKFMINAQNGNHEKGNDLYIEILGQFAGQQDQLRSLLYPLYQLAAPSLEIIQNLPYWDAQEFLSEDGNPEYAHERSRFCFSKISQDGRDTIFRNLRKWPGTSIDAMWKYFLMGGKIKEIPKSATSFPFRQATMITSIDVEWLPADHRDLEANFKWLDTFHDEMEKYTSPYCYVNFTDRRQKNHLNAYYSDHLDRLKAVKRQLDPDNTFYNPQSIPSK